MLRMRDGDAGGCDKVPPLRLRDQQTRAGLLVTFAVIAKILS